MLIYFLWFFAAIGFAVYAPGCLLVAMLTYRANADRVPNIALRVLAAVVAAAFWPLIAFGSAVLELIAFTYHRGE